MAEKSTPFSLPPSLLLPFLKPAWFLMVGGDRSFKLALTEKSSEFSDELRKDCQVKGMEQRGGGEAAVKGDGEKGEGRDGEGKEKGEVGGELEGRGGEGKEVKGEG